MSGLALLSRDRRTVGTEATQLETYRFWHLDYGEVAYYDQLVFKRHQPIPPERDGRRTSGGTVDSPATL